MLRTIIVLKTFLISFALLFHSAVKAGQLNWDEYVFQVNEEYQTFRGLPCTFNGATVMTNNNAAVLGDLTRKCAPNAGGYKGKKGQSIHAKRGTPVYAIADMLLVKAKNTSAKKRTGRMGANNIIGSTNIGSSPYDDLALTFIDKFGNEILYYHLMTPNPAVPGFGRGKCKLPEEWKSKKQSEKPGGCGGFKKKNFKKGDVIGFVGSTGGAFCEKLGYVCGEHISLGITVTKNDPRFEGDSGMVVPSNNFVWENKPTNDPLKYLLPISVAKPVKAALMENESMYESLEGCPATLTVKNESEDLYFSFTDCDVEKTKLFEKVDKSSVLYSDLSDLANKDPRYFKGLTNISGRDSDALIAIGKTFMWVRGKVKIEGTWCDIAHKREDPTVLSVKCENREEFSGRFPN